MHIFADMSHLMTFLVKFNHIHRPGIIIQIIDHFPTILTYDVIFTPTIWEFGTFSPKMTYFDEIDPINDTFEQIYVHKPYWNNF